MSDEVKDKDSKKEDTSNIWTCEIDYEFDQFPELEPITESKKQPEKPVPPPAPVPQQSQGQNAEEAPAPPPDTSPVSLAKMTVGRKFLMRCQGEPVFFKKKSLQIFAESKDPSVLKLLGVRRIDEKSVDLIMTSYRPGKQLIPRVVLSDGDEAVVFENVAFEVQSVVKAQAGKPPQPFGPFGPIQLAWPMWIWLAIAGLIAFFLASTVFGVVRRARYKRRLKELEKFDVAIGAYRQFTKQMREFKRRFEFEDHDELLENKEAVEQMDQALRFYIVRELRIPAHEWSTSKVIKEIKKRHAAIYRESHLELRNCFKELSKALEEEQKVSWQDCSLLHTHLLKTVTSIWKISESKNKTKKSKQQRRGA